MDFGEIGKKIYDIRKSRECRRYWVFRIRCVLNRARMKKLWDYFHSTPVLQKISELYPFVYEQPQRAFFYHRSTFEERAALVEMHFAFLAERLRENVLFSLYREEPLPLWDGPILDEKPLTLSLFYEPGQRKEGILSVMLRLADMPLYQMIFWLSPNPSGEPSLWIGAMQGPNMEDAREIVKRATKLCHAYRTKNLILYATQAVARALGAAHIYAVTNEGYYTNNHLRMDKKLKTDFSDFWREAGGKETEDKRFDELPLIEPRKTMEEVPTRKRAVYRRRFAMLDELDAAVAENMKNAMH
ncbi:MAG: VirK/YbjX family protein [Selenomonadaceae bacterium]|nr:VirK/YbjX family protein [Selenomonadaceae bacterium]